MLALKWKHIDFENGYLSVEENLVTVNNERITKAPKTQSGKRSIQIPATLLTLLRDTKTERKANDNDYIICQKDGSPYKSDASLILEHYSLISTEQQSLLDDKQKLVADVNSDGLIDSVDASVILDYYAYCSVCNGISITDYVSLSSDDAYTRFIKELNSGIFQLPQYSGSSYLTIGNNIPFFMPEHYDGNSFEYYSELDELGRCGVCIACIGKDIMPSEERGNIGMIKPTGWHLDKYDIVDGKYLYNRCHLIGYKLTGENANPQNLITGTRYLNMIGMLPFENQIYGYINETDNHVLYRVTPVFENSDLLCRGVLMEGWSLEDDGAGICFNVFCYNAQPGIVIDYSNGDNHLSETMTTTFYEPERTTDTTTEAAVQHDYVANKRTKVFHLPDCSAVDAMNEDNKLYYDGERDQLISDGYTPCKRCSP